MVRSSERNSVGSSKTDKVKLQLQGWQAKSSINFFVTQTTSELTFFLITSIWDGWGQIKPSMSSFFCIITQ